MAGNTELDNAVLGGSADFIGDFVAAMTKTYYAKDDKVKILCWICVCVCVCVNVV